MQVFVRILSLLVGLVLLSCTTDATGKSEARTGMIFETDFKEELTREQMYDQLKAVSPDQVARVLSMVEDKKSTGVTGGLSVDQLLGQNEISTSQCKRRPLRLRVAVCERTKNFTKVNLYCRLCLVEAVRFCLDKVDSILKDGLIDEADRDFLLRLSSHIPKADDDHSGFGSVRTPLEQIVASIN